MLILILTAAVGIALGLVALRLCRRQRRPPAVHHVLMAQHLWQPRELD